MSITLIPSRHPKRLLVSFPYDPALVEQVKQIPGAKFDPDHRAWSISTKYRKKVNEFSDAAGKAGADFIQELRARSSEIYDACPALDVRIEYWSTGCAVYASGRADMGPIKGAIPAARWDPRARHYRIDVSTTDRIEMLIAALREVRDNAEEKRQKLKKAYEAERLEHAEAAAAARQNRMAVLVRNAPGIGAIVRHGDRIVRITSHGTSWRLSDDDASMGWHPSDAGEQVCYAYYDDATDDEIATLEASEGEVAERHRIQTERKAAIATVAASDDMPAISTEPDGDTIWSDDRSAVVGYRTWIVLTPDGWLWHLTYNGSDGGTWGEMNCGYNTIGRRVPATDELIAAIRGSKETE